MHTVVKLSGPRKTEVEAGIKAKLNAKLKGHNLGQHLNHIWKHVRKEFFSSIDYNDYGLTETVRLKYFDAEVCESFLLHRDLKTKVELLDLIEDFFEVQHHFLFFFGSTDCLAKLHYVPHIVQFSNFSS